MIDYVFTWLPVRISVFDGKHWHYTRHHAWLRKVRRVRTVWGDTIYTESCYE
jgi:hypothetical protein